MLVLQLVETGVTVNLERGEGRGDSVSACCWAPSNEQDSCCSPTRVTLNRQLGEGSGLGRGLGDGLGKGLRSLPCDFSLQFSSSVGLMTGNSSSVGGRGVEQVREIFLDDKLKATSFPGVSLVDDFNSPTVSHSDAATAADSACCFSWTKQHSAISFVSRSYSA